MSRDGGERERHEVGVGRRVVGPPGVDDQPFGRIGLEVEERGHDLGTGHTVDRRMMHLADEGDAAAFEPLDDIQLPQRSIAVEGQPADLGGVLRQFACPAR